MMWKVQSIGDKMRALSALQTDGHAAVVWGGIEPPTQGLKILVQDIFQ
jgi:hypothetical protein